MTPIEEKIAELEGRGVKLGVKLSFELPLFDGGMLQDFDNGTIYYHPTVGAFLVQGEILREYRDRGEVQSGLGYPTWDEDEDPFVLLGRKQDFEFGTITFSDKFGVNVEFREVVTVPEVVVKIHDGIPITLSPGGVFSLEDLVFNLGFRDEFIIAAIQAIFPDILFHRTFESMGSQEILDLVAKVQEQDPNYSPPNFDNFLEIVCPVGFDTRTLADILNGWQGVVEYAYTAPVASDAAVIGTGNEHFSKQGYLEPGPKGIGVQAAWAKGADGSGRNIIDIEKGWFIDHEDLPSGIQLLDGRNIWDSMGHGAAVLGEIVAVDNTKGVVGIAPAARAHLLSTRTHAPRFWPLVKERVADMILKATQLLFHGDVILIEVQFPDESDTADPPRDVPVETDRRVFEAIRLATKLGFIVVEAGGNGKFDLDNYVNHEGKKVLMRGSPDFKDSGAIMVGSCKSSIPTPGAGHPRATHSNFGSRIDSYAWGENIFTTGTKSFPVEKDSYMNNMGGTSGASAIIAGVCLLIQNIQTLMTPTSGITGLLRPADMQRILSKPANGTGSPDRIGVMPDFKKIITNEYH